MVIRSRRQGTLAEAGVDRPFPVAGQPGVVHVRIRLAWESVCVRRASFRMSDDSRSFHSVLLRPRSNPIADHRRR
jgi:hypothetical protein